MRRLGLSLSVLALAVLGMATAAVSASAAPRPYEASFTEGLEFPRPVTLGADGNPIVGNIGNGTVVFYDSGGKVVRTETGDGKWEAGFGSGIESLELNRATGELYVAARKGVFVFDEKGDYQRELPGLAGESFNVDVDNSAGASAGFAYASTCCGTSELFKYDPDGNPSEFTHDDPTYVKGSRITGTPGGNFTGIFGITVDRDGYIYVVDGIAGEVDKFEPSGRFVKAFKGAGAPGNTLNGPFRAAVDPTNGNLLIANFDSILEFEEDGTYLQTIKEKSNPESVFFAVGGVVVTETGRLWATELFGGELIRYGPAETAPVVSYGPVSGETQTGGTVNASVDPNGVGPITGCTVEYGTTLEYGSSKSCDPGPPYADLTGVSASLTGLTTEQPYNFRVTVTNAARTYHGANQAFTPHAVLGVLTEPATEVRSYPVAEAKRPSAKLNGSWVGNGDPTSYFFEWGETREYGNSTPVIPGGSAAGQTKVSAVIEDLDPVRTYHFRVVAQNSKGTTHGEDVRFTTPPEYPQVESWVTDVHADSADMHANVSPGGGQTSYHFEYGTTTAYGDSTDPVEVGGGTSPIQVHQIVTGLIQGTTYHYRVVATNPAGTTEGPDRTFATFPYTPASEDKCPNALARKQTGAALLLDCRAYEIVSAADAAGYSVASNLISGQQPYEGYPHASAPSRVLYTTVDGGIPGTGSPTNRGRDPYVATRGAGGWTTRYARGRCRRLRRSLPLGSHRRVGRPRHPCLRGLRHLLALFPRRQLRDPAAAPGRLPGAGDGRIDPQRLAGPGRVRGQAALR